MKTKVNARFVTLYIASEQMIQRLFFCAFFLCQFATISKSQESGWFPISEGQLWARTGCFFGDTLGYVFGGDYDGNAYMYKTEDQGVTWDTVSSYNPSWRPSVAEFINPMVGFFGNENNGYIQKTEDGGVTWTTNTTFSFLETADIAFVTDSIGFITLNWFQGLGDGEIWRTIDQGNNWTQCTAFDLSPTISNWFAPSTICPLNADTIFIMATGGGNWNPPGYPGSERFLRTYNGGDQWLINGTEAANVYHIDMKIFEDGTGLLAGQSYLFETSDYGLTWDTIVYPPSMTGVVQGLIVNDSTWHFQTYYSNLLCSTSDRGNSWLFHHNVPSRKDFLAIDESSVFSLGYPIYKFTDDLMRLKGNLFYDSNQNQLRDSSEQGLANVEMDLSTYAGVYFTDNDGGYEIIVDSGTHSITPVIGVMWDLSTDSASYTRTPFSSTPHSDSLNFGFYPNIWVDSLQTHLITDALRCDDTVSIWLSISNLGTTLPFGTTTLSLDDSLSFVSAIPEPDTVIGQVITWSFDSILVYQDSLFHVSVGTPDFNSIGDTLILYADVFALDSNLVSNLATSDTLLEISTCAYDPNDKNVYPVGDGESHLIGRDQELTYRIRFQNTGNATAHDVRVIDTLSNLLNLETFRFLASSADVSTSIDPAGVVTFYFEDIFLPDSGYNEPESHGFVSFAITPILTLAPNTEILNSAGIYFDYNPPVITNSVFSTIECYLAPPIAQLEFNYPSIVSSNFQIADYDISWFLNGELLDNQVEPTLIPQENGVYSLELVDSNGCATVSEVFNFLSSDVGSLEFTKVSIVPNPAVHTAAVVFSESLNDNWSFRLVDLLGRTQAVGQKKSENKIVFDVSNLPSGVLLIQSQNKATDVLHHLGKLVVQ